MHLKPYALIILVGLIIIFVFSLQSSHNEIRTESKVSPIKEPIKSSPMQLDTLSKKTSVDIVVNDENNIEAENNFISESELVRKNNIEATISAGFSIKAAEIMESSIIPNHKKLISIEDAPKQLQGMLKKNLSSLKNNGYISVDEDKAEFYETLPERINTLDENHYKFVDKLTDLSSSKFTELEFMGVAGIGPPGDGHWTFGARMYMDDQNRVISLEEYNHLKSGQAYTRQKEFINTTVNGYDAKLIAYRTPSGKEYTALEWLTTEKSYSLVYPGNIVGTEDAEQIKALAESIPLEDINNNINFK